MGAPEPADVDTQRARFRGLAEMVEEAVVLVEATGTVVWGNRRWSALGDGVRSIAELEERPGRLAQALGELTSPAGVGTTTEVMVHRADRTVVRVLLRSHADDPGHVLATVVSVSREALRAAAERDELTNLATRATFEAELADALRHERDEIAVLHLDLNGFADLNSEHGHEAGDQVLVAIGQRLIHTLRPGDVVARDHGDRFLTLCRGVQRGNENIIMARIDDALADPISWPGGWWQPSASIGVVRGDEAPDVEGIISAVTASSARAKKGRVVAPSLDGLRDLSSARSRRRN